MAKDKTKPKKNSKKVKREIANVLNKEERTRRKLMMMNPYAQTLIDPFNVRGVRIPDDALYPSVPFTIVDRRTLTASASGITGLCYGYRSSSSAVSKGSLIPINITSDTVGSYSAGMIFGSAATTGDLTFGTLNTTGPNDIKFNQWNGTTFTVQGAFDKVRLVSAGVNVQCTANFSNNQGKYTAGFAARNYSRGNGGLAFPLTYVQNLPDSISVPISLEQGVTVTYAPCDEYCFRYSEIGINQSVGAPFSYTIGGAQDWETNAQVSPGEIWIAVDGASASATFLVTAVFNYEGIPSSNNFLLASAAKTSSSDPIALTHGLRVADAVPQAQASSAEANGVINDTPAEELSVEDDKEPEMFNSIMNVISSAPEFVSKAASSLSKFTPLLEAGLAMI